VYLFRGWRLDGWHTQKLQLSRLNHVLSGSKLGDRAGSFSAAGTSLYAPPGRGQWTQLERTLGAPWADLECSRLWSRPRRPARRCLSGGVYLGWFPRARDSRGVACGALESKCGHWLRS
jgi:hypothetical protein